MTAQSLVQEFCDKMVQRDAEALRPYLDEAVVYQNVGRPAAQGADAVVTDLAGQFAQFPDSYEYETVNIVSDGDVVMTERIDYVRSADGSRHGLPVMGTFVLRDGKIIRWTDYWDSNLIKTMMTGAEYKELIPAY